MSTRDPAAAVPTSHATLAAAAFGAPSAAGGGGGGSNTHHSPSTAQKRLYYVLVKDAEHGTWGDEVELHTSAMCIERLLDAVHAKVGVEPSSIQLLRDRGVWEDVTLEECGCIDEWPPPVKLRVVPRKGLGGVFAPTLGVAEGWMDRRRLAALLNTPGYVGAYDLNVTHHAILRVRSGVDGGYSAARLRGVCRGMSAGLMLYVEMVKGANIIADFKVLDSVSNKPPTHAECADWISALRGCGARAPTELEHRFSALVLGITEDALRLKLAGRLGVSSSAAAPAGEAAAAVAARSSSPPPPPPPPPPAPESSPPHSPHGSTHADPTLPADAAEAVPMAAADGEVSKEQSPVRRRKKRGATKGSGRKRDGGSSGGCGALNEAVAADADDDDDILLQAASSSPCVAETSSRSRSPRELPSKPQVSPHSCFRKRLMTKAALDVCLRNPLLPSTCSHHTPYLYHSGSRLLLLHCREAALPAGFAARAAQTSPRSTCSSTPAQSPSGCAVGRRPSLRRMLAAAAAADEASAAPHPPQPAPPSRPAVVGGTAAAAAAAAAAPPPPPAFSVALSLVSQASGAAAAYADVDVTPRGFHSPGPPVLWHGGFVLPVVRRRAGAARGGGGGGGGPGGGSPIPSPRGGAGWLRQLRRSSSHSLLRGASDGQLGSVAAAATAPATTAAAAELGLLFSTDGLAWDGGDADVFPVNTPRALDVPAADGFAFPRLVACAETLHLLFVGRAGVNRLCTDDPTAYSWTQAASLVEGLSIAELAQSIGLASASCVTGLSVCDGVPPRWAEGLELAAATEGDEARHRGWTLLLTHRESTEADAASRVTAFVTADLAEFAFVAEVQVAREVGGWCGGGEHEEGGGGVVEVIESASLYNVPATGIWYLLVGCRLAGEGFQRVLAAGTADQGDTWEFLEMRSEAGLLNAYL